MSTRTMSLGTCEIDFLKETLHAQQELLQKLYNELDMERESSATAADEALSMILRLQGEKSALEMEASQYKRIAEEKMCHAQETLEIFQELIFHKEMQIASLEFQVQAYRFKLVSMGCDDLGVCEMQYPDNMLSRSAQSSLRRGSSLPSPLLDALSRRASTEGAKSSQSSPNTFNEIKDPEPSIGGDFNSYWDEIRKLDGRVKELANIKGFNGIFTPENANGTSENASKPPICNPSPEISPIKSDFPEYPEKVQDIFEVPLCFNHKSSLKDEILKSDVKEKIDWERKPLVSPGSNNDSPKPRDTNVKIDWEKRSSLSPCSNNGLAKAKDAKSCEKQLLLKHQTYGVADFELQQFNRRLKQLEDERFVTRGHETDVERGDNELGLLKEIRDKVDLMQAEITSWRTKKSKEGDHSVGCLKEVMLCFWP